MDLKDTKWKCHVCGEERPNDKISVLTIPKNMYGMTIEMNVRYCNDRQVCIDRSEHVDHTERVTQKTVLQKLIKSIREGPD